MMFATSYSSSPSTSIGPGGWESLVWERRGSVCFEQCNVKYVVVLHSYRKFEPASVGSDEFLDLERSLPFYIEFLAGS